MHVYTPVKIENGGDLETNSYNFQFKKLVS